MRSLILALTLVGLYFVIFPIRCRGRGQRSRFMGYNEKPFIDDGDPWDHIDYIKPTFKYGAHPYVAQLSKSAEWADPLRHLPAE
jgi:hypothetical protein